MSLIFAFCRGAAIHPSFPADRAEPGPAWFRIGLPLLACFWAAGAAAAPSLTCAQGAITCVEVEQTGEAAALQPVTFGQAFRDGDVGKGTMLAATDSAGHRLPLQMDEETRYPDGALRFAVFSTLVPELGKGGRRIVSLAPGVPVPAPPPAPAQPFALSVRINLYSPQITIVKFGNRVAQAAGIPFREGETITLHVGDESFQLAIAPNMTKGDFVANQTIAQAFVNVINKRSKLYHASWNGAEAGLEEDLWLTTAEGAAPFKVSADYKGAAKIAVLPYEKPEAPVVWTANLGNDQGMAWLNGPVATERDINLPLLPPSGGKPHPLLSVHVHLRRYPAAGAVRADLVLENDWAYAPGPRNLTYDIDVSRNGESVYRRQHIVHTHHARWHRLIWSAGMSEPVVRQNIPYMLASGLVPHYDPKITVSYAALEADGRHLSALDTGPMGTAGVTLYMPMTGMRADIGPLPQWTAQYLLSMDDRARALTFANADAGGSMPMHYRDQATGLPVSLDRHPGIVLGFGRPDPKDAVPEVANRNNPWTLDVAHMPSLFYVPYLVTGDLYYLEEVMFDADWSIASVDPGLRENAKGLLYGNQIRGAAWALRNLGDAAVILPDRHPMKPYFNEKLQNNLAYYLDHFARHPAATASPLGILENVDQQGKIGPWQYDFLFITVADLARAGIPHADELARFMARFVVGRWSPEAERQGFCHQMAAAYYIRFRDAQGKAYPDWGSLFRGNWPDAKTCPRDFEADSFPGSAIGYVANAYAALGAAGDLHIAGAREAQARLAAELPSMLNEFHADPTFAIISGPPGPS